MERTLTGFDGRIVALRDEDFVKSLLVSGKYKIQPNSFPNQYLIAEVDAAIHNYFILEMSLN